MPKHIRITYMKNNRLALSFSRVYVRLALTCLLVFSIALAVLKLSSNQLEFDPKFMSSVWSKCPCGTSHIKRPTSLHFVFIQSL